MAKVISDFKLQIKLRRFTSDIDKDWKRTKTGLQSDMD